MVTKQQNVVLDLDGLEREDAPEPLVVKLGGKRYRLIDPAAMSMTDIGQLAGNGGAILSIAVAEDKRAEFSAALSRLEAWKLNQLTTEYMKHYKFGDYNQDDEAQE